LLGIDEAAVVSVELVVEDGQEVLVCRASAAPKVPGAVFALSAALSGL
jgi:hypothetical protein